MKKQQDPIERDSAGFPYRALAMVLIAAALVCAVIGIFMLVDNGRHKVEVLTEPTTSSSVPAATTTEKKEEPKAEFDKAKVRVVVLNNTTKEGFAGRTADKLKDAGWTSQSDPANCPEGQCGALERSTVFYKDNPEMKAAGEAAAKELGYPAAPRPDWLKDQDDDLVVILAND
ncbi:MAG: LytR C-terminal domain-containing protein [Lawsonella sp.]